MKSSSRTLDKSSPALPLLPLLVGLEPCVEAAKPALGLRLAGLPNGLPAAFPEVFARFLAALEVGIDAFEPAVPFGGLLAGVSSAGVSGRSGRFEAYGSAVCGLVNSGLRGRRTGPDMSELPFFVVVELVGGVADVVEAVEVTRASGLGLLGRLDGARIV